jgi:hypothetical protein
MQKPLDLYWRRCSLVRLGMQYQFTVRSELEVRDAELQTEDEHSNEDANGVNKEKCNQINLVNYELISCVFLFRLCSVE